MQQVCTILEPSAGNTAETNPKSHQYFIKSIINYYAKNLHRNDIRLLVTTDRRPSTWIN